MKIIPQHLKIVCGCLTFNYLDSHVYPCCLHSDYLHFSFAVDDKPIVFEKIKPKKKRAPPPPNPFGSDEEESVPDPPSSAKKSSDPSKEQPASTVLNPFEDEDEKVTPLFFAHVLPL